MITPSAPATVTMEAENTMSYPMFTRNGIVMDPTAETVAGDEPEIAA